VAGVINCKKVSLFTVNFLCQKQPLFSNYNTDFSDKQDIIRHFMKIYSIF